MIFVKTKHYFKMRTICFNGGISDLAVSHIFIFKKLSARDFEILKKFPRVCTGKGAKYLLFLTIALQGKIFGILCLDSHIYLDYIYFLGGFLFSNCPAGKIFFGYKQSSLAFLIVFSRERREEIWDISEENSSQFGRKKNTAKRSLRSSNFFSQISLRSPKVCL